MDPSSYLSVLISIILGLGITQLVTGLGRLIHARVRIKFYSPTIAWVGLLLIIHVQTRWAMFGCAASCSAVAHVRFAAASE